MFSPACASIRCYTKVCGYLHIIYFLSYHRWGQAVALLNDSLLIHGGKTDQFNAYSYTSAPNTNDLLYLPLTSSFSAASPPWILVSNSTNSSSPFFAWHTLSPSNLPNVLLFGGSPDPNSPTVVVSLADSAQLLNVASPLQPVWSLKSTAWAGEPVRRMRHSTATSSSSQVFIIGGEMADGSGNALSDHYIFNPTVPTFTLLPPNGPPDIYGHASIMLSDGRLLVFGGYSPSQRILLPFSMIWVLDTSQSNLAWSVIQTTTKSLPSPRMAFAAASLNDGTILIHGGSDASLQTNFADGWILDTSQSTMDWTQVEALSNLGTLRDHFAAPQGDLVLFGFGKRKTLYLKSMFTQELIKVIITMVQRPLRCRYTTALLNLLFLCSNPCHLLRPLLQTRRRANFLPVRPVRPYLQARLQV